MVNVSAVVLHYQCWAFGQHLPSALTCSVLAHYAWLGLSYCWAQLLLHALWLNAVHILGLTTATNSVLVLWVHWHKYAREYQCCPLGAGLHIECCWATQSTNVVLVLKASGIMPIGSKDLDKIVKHKLSNSNFKTWATAFYLWSKIQGMAHCLMSKANHADKDNLKEDLRVCSAICATVTQPILQWLLGLKASTGTIPPTAMPATGTSTGTGTGATTSSGTAMSISGIQPMAALLTALQIVTKQTVTVTQNVQIQTCAVHLNCTAVLRLRIM
jgi:hypothetical protein